ncbi:MAG TPA: hypothetical protein VFO55_04915 [Gemmatimonadaceae bacterium]|nr:hypothetical protein [Gemmatimonadaceae bacterium]
MIRAICLAALLLFGRLAVAQRPVVVVRDAGPGPVGRYLTELLARPDTRVIVEDTVAIPVDSVEPGPIVVIGRRLTIAGTVRGDAVIVGGDLFLKPKGRIEGEGIAIGGGAYPSLLGVVRDGLTSHRDFTYEVVRTPEGIELQYREDYVAESQPVVTLPVLFGVRIPSYDRSNGVSLPIGPAVTLGPLTGDALATYRSQIGRIDPSVTLRLTRGRKLWIDAFAGRESRSNDDWINSSLLNSISALVSGRDERNWYRATGGWAVASRMFETPTLVSTYSLGAGTERATSARPDSFPTSGPWSIMGRESDEGMFRPNPQLPGGTITSALAGARYRWTAGDVKARLDLDLEVPVSMSSGERFVQTTVDGRIDFPTFGLQRYRLEVHGVITAGDTAPPQRFAYLGGSGTLPTEDLFVFGGDELLFIESRYEIPVPAVQLPFIGSPILTLRHILGSVGVQRLPDITQIIGARISVPFVRAQLLMDTATGELKFSAGFSFSR